MTPNDPATGSVADSGVIRALYFSTHLSRIPASAAMVAGRINGEFAARPSAWQAFPGSALLPVDVTGRMAWHADALDLTAGSVDLRRVRAWISERATARQQLPALRVRFGQTEYLERFADPGTYVLWVVAVGMPQLRAGATITEHSVLAGVAGARVTVGTCFDAAWLPTPPATREGRADHRRRFPHMTALARGTYYRTSSANNGAGSTR